MSAIDTRRYLTWDATRPFEGVLSPLFRFQNNEWFLRSDVDCTLKTLCLSLLQKPTHRVPFRRFQVTCFAKAPNEQGGIGMKSTQRCEDQGSPKIWEVPVIDILREMKDYASSGRITFVVIFEMEDSSSVVIETKTDVSRNWDLFSLSSDLGNLLKSGEASDVQLKTHGGKRSAHRSILAARSEVFSAMFRNDMDERTSGLVDISDVDGEVMDIFLQYVYTGKIPDNLDDSTLPELYATGDKYAVHSLKKLCRDRMAEKVSENNYQEFLAFADAHSDEKLKEKIIKSIIENPEWLNCEKWLEFSKQHLALGKDVYQTFYEESYLNKKNITTI